jgi:uncharacterized protein YkwD
MPAGTICLSVLNRLGAPLALALLLPSQAVGQAADSISGRSIVAEINKVRTDPTGYATFLESQLPYYQADEIRRPGQVRIRTVEGAAAVLEAVRALRGQASLPPLDFSDALSRAAEDHVRDQGPKGVTGHDGSDGSTVQGRIERYGTWRITISENIDYGSATARDVVMALVIDDGVPNRGHRRNILDPQIRVAGAACGPHQQYRMMCVIDHAGGFTPATGAGR